MKYIEREAAYPLAKKICDAIDSEDFQRLNFGMRILDWIDDIPVADVRPVVFCKDCVYSDKWYKDRLICYLWNEHDGNSVFEDGFCNYGSKREES